MKGLRETHRGSPRSHPTFCGAAATTPALQTTLGPLSVLQLLRPPPAAFGVTNLLPMAGGVGDQASAHWDRVSPAALALRITESQHGRGWQGPLWLNQSNPLPKQGHPEQAAQDLVQAGLEYLQRRRLHSPSGQPGPGLRQSEKVLPRVQMELPMLQFVPVALCPAAGHHWKESGPILLTPTLQIFVGISKVLSQPYPAVSSSCPRKAVVSVRNFSQHCSQQAGW